MHFFKLVIIFCCFYGFPAFAGTIKCEPQTSTTNHYNQWAEMHKSFDVSVKGVNTTLDAQIPDWTVLYTATDVVIGNDSGVCNAGGVQNYFTMLSQISSVGHQGSDYIYATNVPGIGISVAESYSGRYYSMQPYPWVDHWAGLLNGIGFHATIKYWKIPNGNIPLDAGAITVNGPEYAVVYEESGYDFTSSDLDRITSDKKAYINGSRIIVATLIFQPGTCNIEGGDINVNMGDYDGKDGSSEWKNASFKLLCPTGYGYGGGTYSGYGSAYNYPYSINGNTYTVNANTHNNGQVQISIVPLNNGAIDPSRGIIALDGTGAQGYGIQLAWGDYSTQNATEPVHPVILNSYVDAHSLNSAFSGDLTPFGGNGFTGGDNTIKMAARYIRTSGDAASGPANAVVQVIASYQ
ncbi:fimbrial protein [Citrobacter amalonaticus]|uniref:fimbrial protein n=1 Tax=Citrobacter amalonaticus TaxID=35703 RepID=UPI001A2DCC97|nr:fimbrial protein [Citrobacter amalonaticus]HDQ2811744.1 fimbrial protein [Citrobacter amalonaticus]